jgi:Rps23 Pro-64 3,4-dihydroxylase Tpa1-like proline 4-hydroxylase
MTEFKIYKAETNFKFNLSDYPDMFDFSLIEKYGWYSPSNKKNNLSGVSRDHMLSVKEGFELGIDPKLLAHPANCKLMIHNDNVSKNKKSSITLEELLERIENFKI